MLIVTLSRSSFLITILTSPRILFLYSWNFVAIIFRQSSGDNDSIKGLMRHLYTTSGISENFMTINALILNLLVSCYLLRSSWIFGSLEQCSPVIKQHLEWLRFCYPFFPPAPHVANPGNRCSTRGFVVNHSPYGLTSLNNDLPVIKENCRATHTTVFYICEMVSTNFKHINANYNIMIF